MNRPLVVGVVIALLLGTIVGVAVSQQIDRPESVDDTTASPTEESLTVVEVPVPKADPEETPFGTVPMTVGSVPVLASVADDREERILGLSGVPGMQEDEVKLFVFPRDDTWSFWMKDMLFSIDMIWVSATGTIVHIEESVSPETYPTSFKPDSPARYVVETVAGFSEKHGITKGEQVILPEQLQKN
ncbi:MAG: DUF192 domain-containing protein [Patescibacteria group bacterium]